MFKQVVCRECGFLSLCTSGWFRKPKVYHELTLVDRKKMADGTYYNPPNELLCRRGLWRDHYSSLENVNRKRQCEYFTTYEPGYTPTEHKELTVNRKSTVQKSKLKLIIKIVAKIIAIIMFVAAVLTIISFALGYFK